MPNPANAAVPTADPLKGFRLKTFKSHPSLIPLVTFISAAVAGCSCFMAYALATKPDVRFVRSRGPGELSVGPTQSTLLYTRDVEALKAAAIPDIDALRKEINSHYKR